MTDIDAQIKTLKNQAEAARRTKTKADLQRDNARAIVDKITTRLRTEFGVNSLAAAHDLLDTIDQALQDKMDLVKRELEAFN